MKWYTGDEVLAWPLRDDGWRACPDREHPMMIKVGDGVRLGDRVSIGDGVSLGDRVSIGDYVSAISGLAGGFAWSIWRNKDGDPTLQYGCETHTLAEWATPGCHEARANQHVANAVGRTAYAAITRNLCALAAAHLGGAA